MIFASPWILSLFLLLKSVSGLRDTLADYFPEINGDLTRVTWAHAVNTKEKLQEALKGDAMMIEADIVMGHRNEESKRNNEATMAVMAHPPQSVSNFTLEEFLEIIESSEANKGIKLDFKSRGAFAYSESLLDKLYINYQRDYPVWLNADIIPGPVNATNEVVDPNYFLSRCISRYPHATISIGWSTYLAPGTSEGRYTQEDIDKMTDVLNKNMVISNPVTFAVRAALAARSVDILSSLIETSTAESTTLTVWSSVETDVVDVRGLEELIRKIGKDKVYLDLPKEMSASITATGSSSIVLPSVLLMSMISIILSLL